MAIQTINLGTFANDGTGDDLRAAFEKVNANFSELDTVLIANGQNLGTGQVIFAGKSPNPGVGENLTFKSLKNGQNINLVSDATSITINATSLITQVADDSSPQLGGDLDLNDNAILNYASPGVFGTIQLNGLRIGQSGNVVSLGNFVFNHSLEIAAATDLTLSAGPGGNITVSSEVFFNEQINADVVGSLTGQVIGNVVGTVSSITNHDLSDLGDVAATAPTSGQILAYNGSEWAPSAAVTGFPGNDAIDWEFLPFNGIPTNPIQFLLNDYSFDFGTFASPSGPSFNLGTF